MNEPTKCRKCGRIIAFVPTKNGKQMPVDGFSVYVQPYVRGSLFYTSSGNVIRGSLCRKGDKGAIAAYQSHFATCAYADLLRKTEPRFNKTREKIKRTVEREREEAAKRERRRENKARKVREIAEAEEAQLSIFEEVPHLRETGGKNADN